MTTIQCRTGRLLMSAVAVAALAGCSADGDDRVNGADAPPTGAAGALAPSASAAPSLDAPRPARLTAEPSGGQASCVEQRTASATTAMFDPIAKARGDLTITAVSALGPDVRLVAAEGVVVTSKPTNGPGIQVGGGWPMDSERLRRKTEISTRQDLRGMEMTDGQRVLPLIRVRTAKGAVLDGIELSWTDAGGRGGTVTLPIDTTFSGAPCRL